MKSLLVLVLVVRLLFLILCFPCRRDFRDRGGRREQQAEGDEQLEDHVVGLRAVRAEHEQRARRQREDGRLGRTAVAPRDRRRKEERRRELLRQTVDLHVFDHLQREAVAVGQREDGELVGRGGGRRG